MTHYRPVKDDGTTGPLFNSATLAALWYLGRLDSHRWKWEAVESPILTQQENQP